VINTILTASQRSSTFGELIHTHGWKCRSSVMLSLVMVHLVDWHGGVHDMRLYSLLVHNRLDGLMNVVMRVFASHYRHGL